MWISPESANYSLVVEKKTAGRIWNQATGVGTYETGN